MKRYFAKPGTWFDEGTEVTVLVDCGDFGLFAGVREGKPDEETCPWAEFAVRQYAQGPL